MSNISKTLVVTLCAGSLLALAGFRSPQTAPQKGSPPPASSEQLIPMQQPPIKGGQPVPVVQQPVDPALLIVKADPMDVDFGEIPTGDSASRMVKLMNTGDKPMTIITHRVTCGCTALDLAPNFVLGPKEIKEVKVQLQGGANAGPLHGKKVTCGIL